MDEDNSMLLANESEVDDVDFLLLLFTTSSSLGGNKWSIDLRGKLTAAQRTILGVNMGAALRHTSSSIE